MQAMQNKGIAIDVFPKKIRAAIGTDKSILAKVSAFAKFTVSSAQKPYVWKKYTKFFDTTRTESNGDFVSPFA